LDKSNIIISIIIVLCVAAAVAAYGITNSDNPIFSGLSSIPSDSNVGDGIGNTTPGNNSNSPISADTSGGSSAGSSSGSGTGSGSGSGSGSGTGGGSGSGGAGSGSGGGSSRTHLSHSEAKNIASNAVQEAGCYVGNGKYSDGYWYFTVYDQSGNNVDTISVNDKTGATGRG